MGHFTYEIDEIKLRVKLRDLEDPMPEDAWDKFQSSTGPIRIRPASRSSMRFQIPVTRQIIVPVTFGTAILLLSLLLYNFISVVKQKPVSASEVQTELNTSTPQTPAPKTEVQSAPTATVATTPAKSTAQPTYVTRAYARHATPAATVQTEAEPEMEILPNIHPVLAPQEPELQIKVE